MNDSWNYHRFSSIIIPFERGLTFIHCSKKGPITLSFISKHNKTNTTSWSFEFTRVCFSKVPKVCGSISSGIILFIFSKRRRPKALNFEVIFIFIPFTTYKKTSLWMDFQALKVFDALIMILNPEWVFLQERMRNWQIHTVPRTTCTYHMEKITGTLFYIYWKWLLFRVELSGWKGSVSYGLGADISLPPCLATGIWNLAPKATSGPKSRGASFGTTLWRHVQRYCAHFRVFMLIQCSGYFVHTCASVLKWGTPPLVFSLRMRSFSRTEFPTISVE